MWVDYEIQSENGVILSGFTVLSMRVEEDKISLSGIDKSIKMTRGKIEITEKTGIYFPNYIFILGEEYKIEDFDSLYNELMFYSEEY